MASVKVIRIPERKFAIAHMGYLRSWAVCLGWYALEIRTQWLSDLRWAIKSRLRKGAR